VHIDSSRYSHTSVQYVLLSVLATVTYVYIVNAKLQIVTMGDYICVVFFCVCWQP